MSTPPLPPSAARRESFARRAESLIENVSTVKLHYILFYFYIEQKKKREKQMNRYIVWMW